MTEDNMLDDFFAHSLAMLPYLEDMARMVVDLSHRFPHMNIVEIDWTPIYPYPFLLQLFTRISARVLVGPELCHNDEWLGATQQYVSSFLKAVSSVRARYHSLLGWTAKCINADAKGVYKHRQRAADILRPVLQARMDAEAQGIEAGLEDGIQWLMDAYRANGKRPTAEQLALDETGFICGIHPQQLSHPALYPRMAAVPWTFSYGLHIPAGTQVSFPNRQLNLGQDIHPDATTFDAKCFFRRREGADADKFHFASVPGHSLNFGAGFHACPGRFLAKEAIKLIFVHMLTHSGFKYSEEGQQRPVDKPDNLQMLPNFATPIMFIEIPLK
ncbi:hypothetical protein DL770_010019 [Monosporascus sp. CRB-9-2]|nr:hypothetical protein DL770_010019 [Monosporascus sp. CRB-9-2]